MTWIIGLLIGWVPYASAMDVVVPIDEARTLNRFFPMATPDRGITCDQPIKFVQNAVRCDIVCERNPCMTVCSPAVKPAFLVQAENCSSDKIEVVSTLSWMAMVDKSVSSSTGQNWLEEFLASTDYFLVPSGTLTVDAVFPTPATARYVDESGDEHLIQVARVFVSYMQIKDGPTVGFEVHLWIGKTGVEQLLYFGDGERSGDFFFKQWGYVR